MRTPDRESISRDPHTGGPLVVAWRLDVSHPPTVDQTATLGGWLIQGPFHPLWSYWLICVVHLRPIAGARPPTIVTPGAEHEFSIISLNSAPTSPDLNPDPDDIATFHHLTPADLNYQVAGLTDALAVKLVDLMAREVIEGAISPDSDFRHIWEGWLDLTAAQFRRGVRS